MKAAVRQEEETSPLPSVFIPPSEEEEKKSKKKVLLVPALTQCVSQSACQAAPRLACKQGHVASVGNRGKRPRSGAEYARETGWMDIGVRRESTLGQRSAPEFQPSSVLHLQLCDLK